MGKVFDESCEHYEIHNYYDECIIWSPLHSLGNWFDLTMKCPGDSKYQANLSVKHYFVHLSSFYLETNNHILAYWTLITQQWAALDKDTIVQSKYDSTFKREAFATKLGLISAYCYEASHAIVSMKIIMDTIP